MPLIFPLSGANKPSYAPEPLDVGRILQAEISVNGSRDSVTTAGPVDSGNLTYTMRALALIDSF